MAQSTRQQSGDIGTMDKVNMTEYERVLYWIRTEIPTYLDKCGSAQEFETEFHGVCASYYWKQIAIEMAILRWPEATMALMDLRGNN